MNLNRIYLEKNQINLISPTTFDNLTDLKYFDFSENSCASKYYNVENFGDINDDLNNNCSTTDKIKILGKSSEFYDLEDNRRCTGHFYSSNRFILGDEELCDEKFRALLWKRLFPEYPGTVRNGTRKCRTLRFC